VKDKETRGTCSSQKCPTCKGCMFASSSYADEWEMDLTLMDLRHETTLRLDERIRLDIAIEAAALAG
jgi:hypothetical protein